MVKSSTFNHLDKMINPCHIMFNGLEFYVYIKNLSSAYFSNKDVSRAQLTAVGSLEKIKESEALFILLGYDDDNDVFATWNPYVVKQRIGTATSPSFYSRFSLQKEAAEKRDFIFHELKNESSVLIFPREIITAFLSNIGAFFSDKSDYVAIGSKRRVNANAAYKNLIDIHNLEKFAKHLQLSSYSDNNIQQYVVAIKYLIANSIISKNRKMFLFYDSVNQYANIVDEFLSLPELIDLNKKHENLFSYSFSLYINFLIDEYGIFESVIDKNHKSENILSHNNNSVLREELGKYNFIKNKIDYESPYIDNKGNLTQIMNPELIELLRGDLDTEFPRPMAAFATIEDFYGNRFQNMEMHHWQKLFNNIDWGNKL